MNPAAIAARPVRGQSIWLAVAWVALMAMLAVALAGWWFGVGGPGRALAPGASSGAVAPASATAPQAASPAASALGPASTSPGTAGRP